ncbi:thermonuclease family protein [Nocardioides jensenii]|uniref:thermonuclease family protein n=1 Tax=Nocardioides jensenii TaxID=1843 RepID=UPI0008303145|nr:thermonuclease family protein [Nocardioides jensenii]
MKGLIATATAAIAVLVAGGIKADLPGAPADPGGTEGAVTRVRVVAVVDGDTLRVEDLDGGGLGRVRLLGIDAPEVAHPPKPAECYATEATEQLKQLTPVGSTVVLTTDTGQPDIDRYGRMLRYVDDAATDAARELLDAGAARIYDTDQQLARESDYAAAAQDAHNAESGLWGNC